MTPLAILGAIALVVVALLGAIAKAFAVDEARGYVQNRVRADVEATIALLPVELQDEWGDEWRAELAVLISMPLTAIRFAKGLRHTAAQLIGEPQLVPAGPEVQGTPSTGLLARLAKRWVDETTLERIVQRVERMRWPEMVFVIIGGIAPVPGIAFLVAGWMGLLAMGSLLAGAAAALVALVLMRDRKY